MDGERVDAFALDRDAEVCDRAFAFRLIGPALSRLGRIFQKVAARVIGVAFAVVIDADAATDVNVAVARDTTSEVNRCHIAQPAERFDVTVLRIENEKVAAFAAGGAVDEAFGADGQRADGGFIRTGCVERRITQIAEIDAGLRTTE